MVTQAEIHKKTLSNEIAERIEAAQELRTDFVNLLDKKQAWEDLHRLTQDMDSYVRYYAVDALSSTFPHIPDRKQAWIIDLNGTVYVPGPNNPIEQAWEDLQKLIWDRDIYVRLHATEVFGSIFSHISDKKQAWEVLRRLTLEKNIHLRLRAIEAFGSAFPDITDKKQAWRNLQLLMQDTDSYVRYYAVDALCLVFPHIPDKEQGWKNLIQLTKDIDRDVQRHAKEVLSSASPHLSENKQVLDDLYRLTQNLDSDMRLGAADALGSAFPRIPDKKKAWEYLIRLMQDKNSYVRQSAAESLGSAFPYISDKKQAWDDLHQLTLNKESQIWGLANYVLGRVSIFIATETQNEENFRVELESALNFFEKSAKDSIHINPAKFCFPFYRALYAITFKNEDIEAEVQIYLAEAKCAVKGSESREKLVLAIENLANALREANNLQKIDLEIMKCDLNASSRYCERAAALLETAEEKVSIETKLIRKGLPIIDQRIKEILKEIQEKVEALSKKTVDTPYEDLGKKVNQVGKDLLLIRDPIALEKHINNLENALSAICNKMPKNERFEVNGLLKQVRTELLIEDKLPLITNVLNKFSSQMDYINIHYTVIGEVYMGDVFKNIRNAKIINKSVVIDSFNKVNNEYNEEVAKALLQIGEFIEKSSDVPAGILFNKFNEELNKPQAEKSTLRKIWEGIEKTLPSIVTISDIVAKIAPLF